MKRSRSEFLILPSNEPQSAKPAEVTPTEKITATTTTPVKKNIPIPQRTDRSRSDILIEQLNTKPQKFQVPEATVRDPVVTLRDIAKVVPSKKRQCPATVTSQQQIDDEKAAEELRTTKQPSTTTVNDRRSSVSSSERHERQFTAENPPQPIKRAKIAQPRNEKTEKPRRAEPPAATTTAHQWHIKNIAAAKWLTSSIRIMDETRPVQRPSTDDTFQQKDARNIVMTMTESMTDRSQNAR